MRYLTHLTETFLFEELLLLFKKVHSFIYDKDCIHVTPGFICWTIFFIDL